MKVSSVDAALQWKAATSQMCISRFTLGHSSNLEGEWACKSTMVLLMGENHSCFSEGFCREVLLSQWLPPFSRSEGANMSIVSTRKADPTPKVSPGKALTWLLSLVLAWSCPQLFLWAAVPVLQLWAAPSSSSHSSRAGRDRGDAHGHCDPFVQRGSVQQESAEQPW